MPSGRRNNAPVRTGVAVRKPSWVESRLSSARIGMPVTPNIVHTAKHAVKAQVVTNRTERFPDFGILYPSSRKKMSANQTPSHVAAAKMPPLPAYHIPPAGELP